MRRFAFTFITLAGILCGSDARAAAAALPTTTTTLTLSQSTVSQGTAIMFTAAVNAGSMPVTQGQVVVCDVTHEAACTPASANLLGLAQLTSFGKASLKMRPGVGVHHVQAHFVGTSTAAQSTSSQSTLSVTPAGGTIPTVTSVVATPVNQNVNPGLYSLSGYVNTSQGGIATGSLSFLVTSPTTPPTTTTIATAALSTTSQIIALGAPASLPSGSGNGVVADFNEDGIPDLAVIGITGAPVSALAGAGDGTFAKPSTSNTVAGLCAGTCIQLATADFNGDGHADIAALESSGSGAQTMYSLQFAYGKGDGTFTTSTAVSLTLAASSTPPQLVVGDYNGDGQPDLLINGAVASGVDLAVALQQPDHSFKITYPTSFGAGGLVPTSNIRAADFNGDGKTDFIGTGSQGPTGLFLSNGDGTFAANTSINAGGFETVATVGDFNGDGVPDVAIFKISYPVVLGNAYLGNGQGAFTQGPTIGLSFNQSSLLNTIDAIDLNGDGFSDLLVTRSGAFDVGLEEEPLLGDGTGNFSQLAGTGSIPAPPPYPTSPLMAVDLNGDGHLDAIYLQTNASGVVSCCQILLNLNSGGQVTATVPSVQMPIGGTLSLVASYAAQGDFGASVSAAVPVSGTAVTTTLTLTASPQTSTLGQPVTLTATLTPYMSSGYSTAGESVTFVTRNTSQSAPLHNGVATFVDSSLPVGTTSVYAEYGGDGVFSSSLSSAVPVVVNAATAANAALLGNYVFRVTGQLPASDGPVQGIAAVGVFYADGQGNLSGEEDVNSAPLVQTASQFQGSYSLNSNGTGTLHLVNNNGLTQDFGVVLANRNSSGVAQQVSIIGLGPAGIVDSGTASLQTAGSTNPATGAFTLQLDGETACQGNACTSLKHSAGAVSLLGSFVDSLTAGSGAAEENLAGTLANYPSVQTTLSTPDPFGRITLTLAGVGTSTDEPTHFAAYVQSSGDLYLISTDAHQTAILLSGTLVRQ